MATRPIERVIQESAYQVFRWSGLAAGDVGEPLNQGYQFAERTIQVLGTLDGATVAIEGSFDGVTWAPLSDPQGNALSGINSLRIEAVQDVPRLLRPALTGGGASTSVTVYLGGRRTIR